MAALSSSSSASFPLPVIVAGGGIGGLAAALAVARQSFAVKVLEQAPRIGEIGAGIQLGPNAFAAAFRERFANPYAVIPRTDVHGALLEGVQAATDRIEFAASTRVEQAGDGVTA